MAGQHKQRTWTERLGRHDWRGLICAYREDRSSASALLEALEPASRQICATFEALPPLVDRSDIWQEFQVGILEAARTVSIGPRAGWIPVRLLQEARSRVGHWLVQQAKLETEPLSTELIYQRPEEIDPSVSHPIYRRVILGESYELQARRLGIAPATLRQRVSRELRRLRRLRQRGELDDVVSELLSATLGARVQHTSSAPTSLSKEMP